MLRAIFDVIFFYILFKVFNLNTAITFLIIFQILRVAFLYVKKENIKNESLIALATVFFGGLTVIYNEPKILQWKLTIVFFLLSISFLVSTYIFKFNIVKKIYSIKPMYATEQTWATMNLIWSMGFFLNGIISLYFVKYGSLQQWVDFKTFWSTGLIIFTALLSNIYQYKQMSSDEKEKFKEENR